MFQFVKQTPELIQIQFYFALFRECPFDRVCVCVCLLRGGSYFRDFFFCFIFNLRFSVFDFPYIEFLSALFFSGTFFNILFPPDQMNVPLYTNIQYKQDKKDIYGDT